MSKILLLGPSSDINNFDKEYFLTHKAKGYKLFSYSESIRKICSYGIPLDYWCFLDPYVFITDWDHIHSNLVKTNTTLLVPNIFKKLYNFHKLGMTCRMLQQKNSKRYNYIKNEVDYKKIFKKYIPKDYEPVLNLEDGFKINLKESIWIVYPNSIPTKSENIPFLPNICKFSHRVLPLIINHFSDLEEIKIIGFGHYDQGRFYDNDHKADYKEYKNSYLQIKDYLINQIKINNIKISFDGNPSYYHELTNNLTQ